MKFNISENKILEDSKQLVLNDRFESDSISYHHFVRFFSNKNELSENDIIVSAYFSYGWMPTILNLNFGDKKELDEVVRILNRVRRGDFLKRDELSILKSMFNNSIVGTSKLLHFISPSKYVIWDSRVANYFGINLPNNVELYLQYLEFCHTLDKELLKKVHANVVKQAPCMECATELRTLEFVFFNKGIREKGRKIGDIL